MAPKKKTSASPAAGDILAQAGADALKIKALQIKIKSQKALLDKYQEELDARAPASFKLPRGKTRIPKGSFLRVVIPDVHGAYIDGTAAATCLHDIEILDPAEIILLGDVVDCTAHLCAHRTTGVVAELEHTYDDDIAAAASFLDRLREVAPKAKIEYIAGNHERRVDTWAISTALKTGAPPEDVKSISQSLRRIYAPEYRLHLEKRNIAYFRWDVIHDGLKLPGAILRNGVIYIHGISTAVHAAAQHLARIQGSHHGITFGHTHRIDHTWGRTATGEVLWAASPGCLCNNMPHFLYGKSFPMHNHAYGFQAVDPKANTTWHVNVPIDGKTSQIAALLKQLKR
jgi:hypothetical protein